MLTDDGQRLVTITHSAKRFRRRYKMLTDDGQRPVTITHSEPLAEVSLKFEKSNV